MEKFKVSFEANNQQLKAIGTKHASDTYADIEAEFVLGNRWTDMDSVSAVWWNDFTRVATVLDSQGKCVVPHEVLTRKGCVRVNLVGSIVEGDELITRLTSYSAEAVQVNEKIKLTGSETSEVTPSQYEQFVANVKADANRAEQSATDAKAYADEAEASAQNASESASASAVSASDSARSATASAGYAQDASESAQSAENAKDDAEDARDEILGMRATAETLEAGSDATASYSDGLLTLGIPRGDRGEQGIQGETGATPNLTIGTVETLEPTESATATITGTAENPVLNLGLPQGRTGEVSLEQIEALLPTDTASGDIVTITDGQSVVPAKSLKVTLEPIQAGSGTPSPDNVRPISGRTEVVTQRAGKNLFDANANPNKWIVADGTLSTVTGAGTSDKIETNGKVLTFTTSYANGYSGILCITGYDSSDNLVNRSAINGANSITFTTTAEMSYIRASHYNNADFQLELGSTATAYEPYNGTSYTTNLGQTVYGGTLDVVSGVLTVDRAMVDMGTLNWTYVSIEGFFTSYNDSYKPIENTGVVPNLICSQYTSASMNQIYASVDKVVGTGSVGNYNGRFVVKDSAYTDATAFKTAMNGVQLVYELANPQTIQLTPQEVKLLTGTNNIWSNGDVTLVYSADIQKWVEKKLNANSTTLTLSRPMVQTTETETETE